VTASLTFHGALLQACPGPPAGTDVVHGEPAAASELGWPRAVVAADGASTPL
jgi:hypothetical protein